MNNYKSIYSIELIDKIVQSFKKELSKYKGKPLKEIKKKLDIIISDTFKKIYGDKNE